MEVRMIDRREGKLYRKRLALADTTDRLFYQSVKTRAVGLSICLLLDESGSMGEVFSVAGPQNCEKALRMTCLIQEALDGLPRVDLHIYSHASFGNDDENCLIKRLNTPERKEKEGICGYGRGIQNYDHMAIEVVGKEFIEKSVYEKKMMIVLSDGIPEGHDYHGAGAIAQTKKSVEDLEKKGVYMMQIAIDAAEPERMFKNFIRFDDTDKMISGMGKVVKKLVFSSGREEY